MPSYSSYKPSAGVTKLTAGTGTNVSTSTGNVSVWINATNLDPTGTSSTFTISNNTNAFNTFSGALIVVGGVGVGQNLYATELYDGGSRVITTATIGDYSANAILTAFTDTTVSYDFATTSTYIWNTSKLQSVTDRGATTNNAISITNTTQSDSSTTGALIVSGGVAIAKRLNAFEIYENQNRVLTTASLAILGVTSITAGTDIAINTTTGNVTISDAANLQGVTSRGAETNISIKITSSATSTSTATGALVIEGGVGIGQTLNVGEKVVVSGPVDLKTLALVRSNPLDYNSSATVSIFSTDSIGYSALNIQNKSGGGQSYTFEVGGVNRGFLNGRLNESNLGLSDDIAGVYRLVLVKDTGNVIIGNTNYTAVTTTIDNGYKLQVLGGISAQNANINTATIGTLTVTNLIVVSTATIASFDLSTITVQTLIGPLSVVNTATFEDAVFTGNTDFLQPISYQQTLIDTAVTTVTNTLTTLIASFPTTLYRSARSVVQIEDPGLNYQLTEVVLIVGNTGTVYKSEYGIITTNGDSGVFSASYSSSTVKLFFSAFTATNKIVTVTKTSIPRSDFTGIS